MTLPTLLHSYVAYPGYSWSWNTECLYLSTTVAPRLLPSSWLLLVPQARPMLPFQHQVDSLHVITEEGFSNSKHYERSNTATLLQLGTASVA